MRVEEVGLRVEEEVVPIVGVLVVGTPPTRVHVVGLLLACGAPVVKRLALHGLEHDVNAQAALPDALYGLGDGPRLRGLGRERELHVRRPALSVRIAGLGEQLLRLREVVPERVVLLLAGDTRRHDRDRVEVSVLQNDLVDALGVRGHREGLADLEVVERRVGGVEDDPLRALTLELLHFLAQDGIGLGARDVGAHENRAVDLARLVGDDRLGRDVVVKGPDDAGRARVVAPVVGILLHGHALLGLPLDQPVMAVRDVRVRAERPLVGGLLDHVLADRVGRPRRDEVHEERRRPLEGHDEGLIIRGLHGHAVRGALPGAERLAALYRPERLRIA